MALPDWQFISILVSIFGSAVTATAVITWRMATAQTEIRNLKENLKRAEEDITYMMRLDHEEARGAAGKVRRDLKPTDADKDKAGDKEK